MKSSCQGQHGKCQGMECAGGMVRGIGFNILIFYLELLLPDSKGSFACAHQSPVRQTGVCRKESKGSGIEPRDTSVLTFKDLAPQWFLGDSSYRGEIISHGLPRELGSWDLLSRWGLGRR